MTIRRSSAYLVVAVALALPAAGCAHADRAGAAAGGPAPALSGPTAAPDPAGTAVGPQATPTTLGVPAPPASAPDPARPGTESGRTVDPASAATGPARLAALPSTDTDPSCRPPVLLEATGAALNGQSVTDVQVLGCRNGFARLMAIAPQSASIPGGDQVFLRKDTKGWRVVGRTSASTDCGDPGLVTAVRAVCAGLA
ncbi:MULTISPECIES: hypothetical protein [unclassified Micromonospora]|uniref:hypothetical protein n=1 Tax=unclassified Micromonospora TaxID=2617518 RepID=UPI0033E93442